MRTYSVFFLLVMQACLFGFAQDDPAGHWEGGIQLPNGTDMGVVIDLKQDQGAWRGTIAIPAQGLKGFALSNVAVQAQDVSFEMANVPGTPTFKGKLAADGKTIEGTMTQGEASLPFKVRRLSQAEVDAAARKEAELKPDSTWEGTLNAGPSTLRLVLRIFKGPEGTLTAKMDSPDQNVTGIAVPTVKMTADKLNLELPALTASYDGTFNQAKTEVTGQWTQMGNSFPLTLKKVDKPSQ